MRLSIAFLFLIGAMVATEVICDPETTAAELCTWFGQTVHRLQNRQTLKQNRKFIELAVVKANQLLISFYSTIRPASMPQYHVPPIPNFSDFQVTYQIGVIQQLLLRHKPGPHLHVSKVLDAIMQVLLGNFEWARAAIDQSKARLTGSISPSNQVESSSTTPGGRKLDTNIIPDPPIPIDFFDGTEKAIATIREWIKSSGLHGRVRNEAFMECLSEIAQVIVNSLPDVCFAGGKSKFIGRPVLEEPDRIGVRFDGIETRIDDCLKGMEIPLEVGLKKDVLKAIRLMFTNGFVDAGQMIDDSIKNRPFSVTADDVTSFGTYIDTLYGLQAVQASSTGNNS